MLKSNQKSWLAVFAVYLAAVLLTSCSWQGARMRHNWQVQGQFDLYDLYPGHQYFTSGTLQDPRGVLALRPDYHLNSDGWTSVPMTEALLEQWVTALKKDSFVQYNTFSNGAQIIDPEGNVVGYYYSTWDFPLVRFTGPTTIVIRKPYADYRWDNDQSDFLSDDDDWMD